jgi:uncharacterized protein
MEFDLVKIVLILVTGVVAGILNVMAGGGSLLTLPMLIFLGLPSADANGTNRVAIQVQNIIAILGFRSKGIFNLKLSLLFAIPALVGAIVGARIAIELEDKLFNQILAGIMILALALILWNPTRRLKHVDITMTPTRRLIAIVVFFLVGIYGGFIQAGVGFILIAALVLITGLDLVRTNSHKVFIVAVYTFSALATFALEGKVDWALGLVLAVGNGAGGWIGSRFQVAKGEKWVQIVLIVAVLAMAVRLLGIIPGWS